MRPAAISSFGLRPRLALDWLPVPVKVIATKEALSRCALKKSVETTRAALQGDAWYHRFDAITSGAAFSGITVALIGGEAPAGQGWKQVPVFSEAGRGLGFEASRGGGRFMTGNMAHRTFHRSTSDPLRAAVRVTIAGGRQGN